MLSDPRVPGRIWLTTYPATAFDQRDYGSIDLYRSEDAGRTWALVKRGVPAHFLALGATTDELYVSGSSSTTTQAVWRTIDGGLTWKVVKGYQSVAYGVFTSQADPNLVFVISSSFVLFRSSDRGEHFSAVPGVANVYRFITDATDPSVALIATIDGAIYRSADGGKTFTQVDGLLYDEQGRNFVQDPFDPRVFYLANNYAYRPDRVVLVSRDRGLTWMASGSGLPTIALVDDIETDPYTAGRLYAGTGDGLFVSTNGGGSWAAAPAAGLYRGAFLASEGVPHESRYVYDATVAAKDAVFVASVDGSREFFSATAGASFVDASPPQPTARQDMYNVATSAADPSVVWTSGTDAFVYRSTDGGHSYAFASGNLPDPNWVPTSLAYIAFIFSPVVPIVPRDAGRPALVADQTDARRAWVTRTTRVFRTDDAGTTWSASTRLPDVWDLAQDPSNPQVLYAATRAGVYRSADGGRTFAESSNGMGPLEIWSVALAADDPTTVYASTYRAGLWVSRNAGASWSRLGGAGLPDDYPVNEIGTLPGNPDRLIVSTYAGSFRSSDGGTTFEPFPLEGEVMSVEVVDASTHYVATAYPGGVHVTHDGGATYEGIPGPGPSLDPNWVGSVDTSPADPRSIVVGSFGTFVYEPPQP
jgi:photosystem II stability/assembly factor-like uncharacterized protein